MAIELTKTTKITTSVATLIAMVGFLWAAFAYAAEIKQQIDQNSKDIHTAKLVNVKQDIRYYRTEQKKVLIHEESSGVTTLSKELRTDLENTIKDLEKQEKCLTDGGEHCGS